MRHAVWTCAMLGTLLATMPVGAWDLDLPDTALVAGQTARLADLATGPLPAAAADLVIASEGRPGTSRTISRQAILRRLVTAGLARGVRLRGAERCVMVFAGAEVHAGDLAEASRAVIRRLVPPPLAGAPDTWFELEMPPRDLTAADGWTVRCLRNEPLAPGRNAVRCELVDGQQTMSFTATAVLHNFGEVATARVAVPRNQPLLTDHFRWEWRDLAGIRGDPVVDRKALPGASASRNLSAGEMLLERDLKATPVVRSGDQVELWLVRGGMAVRVMAKARQGGCLGQIIPVRNQLTGQLVNARVAAPGVVEWRN